MPIVIQTPGKPNDVRHSTPFANEKELQKLLSENPALIFEEGERAVQLVKREVGLPASGILDILLVDEKGTPIAVEVKLATNVKRREVLAQCFDYTSDLSQITVEELDDLTDGSLEEALDRFGGSTPEASEDRWRSCAANLRAGNIKLIVAVDEASDDLVRIVQYINDHSELDVRLVQLKKYQTGETLLLVPSLLVHKQPDQPSTFSRRGRQVFSDELREVVCLYDQMVEKELRQREVPGRPETWRRMHYNHWPEALHYQFLEDDNTYSLDIHLESPRVKPLWDTLVSLLPRLEKSFPEFKVIRHHAWCDCGRIRMVVPKTMHPANVAGAMVKMIQETHEILDQALLALAKRPKSASTD